MRLAEVEAQLRDNLARIHRNNEQYCVPTRPTGDGTPHIEGEGPLFALIVDDDGREKSRETVDGHELLYRVLRRETRLAVMDLERRTRRVEVPPWVVPLRRVWPGALAGLVGRDDYSRATWIDAHVRLMTHLRSDWGARVQRENDALLRRYPLTPAERAQFRKLDLTEFGLHR